MKKYRLRRGSDVACFPRRAGALKINDAGFVIVIVIANNYVAGRPVQLAVVKACPVEAVALLKDGSCHSAHLFTRRRADPIDYTLTLDKLHRDQVLRVPFKARAYAGIICYFVQARLFVHALSVGVDPPYLERAGFASDLCFKHNPHTALACNASAVYGCSPSKHKRRYTKRPHLCQALGVGIFSKARIRNYPDKPVC